MADTFHLSNGETFSDLEGLSDALRSMDAGTFAFHTEGRNDFATWVGSSVRKPLLAALLRECETPHEMVIALESYSLLRMREEPLVSDVVRDVTARTA